MNIKKYAVLASGGIMALVSLCVTSALSWMGSMLEDHYHEGAKTLLGLPSLGSTIGIFGLGLLVLPLLGSRATPRRIITGSFGATAVLFAVASMLPPLAILAGIALASGFCAFATGAIYSAVPRRAETSKEEGTTIVQTVFTAGTFIVTYGVAVLARWLGLSGGFALLSFLCGGAALLSWFLFKGVAAEPVQAGIQGLRSMWNWALATVMILVGTSKIPIAIFIVTQELALHASKAFADPFWLGACAFMSVLAAGLIPIVITPLSRRMPDNGILMASTLNLLGTLCFLLTLGPVGTWWMVGTLVGMVLLYLGATYEAKAYALATSGYVAQVILINGFVSLGFTGGAQLGPLALVLNFQPVVFALPAAVIGLVMTVAAMPLLVRAVSRVRAAEAEQQRAEGEANQE